MLQTYDDCMDGNVKKKKIVSEYIPEIWANYLLKELQLKQYMLERFPIFKQVKYRVLNHEHQTEKYIK